MPGSCLHTCLFLKFGMPESCSVVIFQLPHYLSPTSVSIPQLYWIKMKNLPGAGNDNGITSDKEPMCNVTSTNVELPFTVKHSKKKMEVLPFLLVNQSQIWGLYGTQVTFFSYLFIYPKILHPFVIELGALPGSCSVWERLLSIPRSCVGPVQQCHVLCPADWCPFRQCNILVTGGRVHLLVTKWSSYTKRQGELRRGGDRAPMGTELH